MPVSYTHLEGEVVGRHKGYYGYTIGQRKGLGISAPKPYYVTEIRPEENRVIVGSNEDLFKTDLIANDFNWIENLAEDEVAKDVYKRQVLYRENLEFREKRNWLAVVSDIVQLVTVCFTEIRLLWLSAAAILRQRMR